jgi:Winged helix DNA-binding domain
MPARRTANELPTLTLRELNRATLARQMLVMRHRIDVVTAIERLAALQAQWSPSPYISLWSRLAGFRREALWSAIAKDHSIVRARLMRGTLHLVSARDFWSYAVATQDLQRAAWNRLQIGRGVDPTRVRELAVAFATAPRVKDEVLSHLRDKVRPAVLGPDGWLVWRFVSAHADLLSAPPGGHWAYGGTDHPYVAAKHWIARGERPSEEEAVEHLVRRCLAAFGPATLADIAKFGGQMPARIRPTLERLRPSLRLFTDEQRRVLYDLPRAPRPPAETAAPVRLLPRYDELLIAYQHRERVMPEKHRAAVYAKNGIIEATLLVDGWVAGTWAIARSASDAIIRITPFGRLSTRDRAAATEEAERLARFLAPDATTHGVRFS